MDNSKSSELYNLLVTRDFDPEILDINGREISDPAQADMFSFDFSADGSNYGTVVILLGTDQDLQVYYGHNISKEMGSDHKTLWYAFLKQLKNFATRNMLTFDLKNLNKLKYTMKGMSAIKEGLHEGYYGNRHTSYSDQPKQTRLVIKHSRALGEGEARYRAIESLFIETNEGERFKLPFTKLSGGRAMARHIAEGGRPYDAVGQYIAEMVSDMDKLGRFVRSVRNRDLDAAAAELAEQAIRHYADLKAKAKKMISRRGYQEAVDEIKNIQPSDAVPVDQLRDLFIEQSLDSRIEEALPVIAKITNSKKTAMQEINEFEEWAETVAEGTWAVPDRPVKLKKLKELLSDPLPVGTDAINATEQIYDLVGDDELYSQLQELSQNSPEADARPMIINRLRELGYDIDAEPATVEDLDTDGVMMTRPSNMSSESIEQIRRLAIT